MNSVLATLMLVILEARAIAAASAEDLYAQGQSAYDAADYATAIAKWTQSYDLSREPELLFNIAQARRLDGDCVQALATYERFVQIDPTSEQRSLADDFVRELEPRCGATTRAPDAERPPTRSERTLKIAGLAVGGGGVALLGAGLLLGHHASTLGEEVTRACAQTCDWSAQKDNDARGRSYATTGRVLDVVGIAAIAAGAVAYYLGDRSDGVAVVPQQREVGVVVTWSGLW
jgi:tetratricopeptide (TPR) repeat protein